MSTDWNVHCVDCNDTHWFNDANHQDRMMSLLIKHADAISALVELVQQDGCIELSTLWGRIDPAWFHRHKGHILKPIDEYGRLLDQCRERVVCKECNSNHRDCIRTHGHIGPCEPKARP